MGALATVLVSDGIEGPIDWLQSVSVIEALEICPHILVHPYFLQHRVQFLLYVNIVLEAELHLLLAL